MHHKPQNYVADVRAQYEDYPYPYHDVDKEGATFHWCDPESLLALSHAGWAGKRDLRKGTRILVAGCGTGDSTVLFAEEVYGSDAEIVAIDLSAKSIEISKARIEKRKLGNVTFHHMSVLDLPTSGLGEFDIIESSGVLHHLSDPNAGLSALASVLKDDGLMAIMVYGQYGRLSIYLVQALMKELMTAETPRDKKIAIAREFLNFVPSQHWITVNNQSFMADLQWPDGSGIYDLFLHSVDRAYTVPQIYEWVEECGLRVSGFFSDLVDESLYDPNSYTPSPMLREIFSSKSLRERQKVAELMNGSIGRHYFYASKQEKKQAILTDDMIITYGAMQSIFLEFVDGFVAALERTELGQRVNGKANGFSSAPDLLITKNRHTIALMRSIDGRRTVAEIVADVAKQSAGDLVEVRENLETLYKEYRTRQVVFLRHKNVAPYKTGSEIIDRLAKALGRK